MPPKRGGGNLRRRTAGQSSEPSRFQPSIRSQDLIESDEDMSQARLFAIWESHVANFEMAVRVKTRELTARFSEPKIGDRDATQVIRATSKILLDELDSVMSERTRLKPAIHVPLEESYFKLRVRLNSMYWRIFRINDLPPEILANIFHFVIRSSTNAATSVIYRLLLTWVCRHWRSVAINDSTIWNVIWFKNRPSYDQPLTWLDRAGKALVDLRIEEGDERKLSDGTDHDGKFTDESMGALLDQIFVKLPQIRQFIVVVDNWPPALAVLHKLSLYGKAGMTLNVERFELHRLKNPYVWIGPGYTPDVHRNPITLFGQASSPHFGYICLNGIHIDWTNSQLSNLTTLDLRRIALNVSPDLSHFRHMLQSSPNLFKLFLDGAGPSAQQIPNSRGLLPISLPHLRILILGDFSLHYGLFVFAQIDAPHVRDLTLMNMTGEDYTPFLSAMICKFTEVRILTLYTLELDDTPSNRQLLVKWLESMPETVYLKIAQIKPHLLEAFVQPVTGGIPCGVVSTPSYGPGGLPYPIAPPRQVVVPKLEFIEYQNMEAHVIIRFLRNRMAMGSPIRKVYVNGPWTSSVSPEEQSELRSLTNLFITPDGSMSPEEARITRENSSA